jgi:peptide/nickel transport system substrate-binding protein
MEDNVLTITDVVKPSHRRAEATQPRAGRLPAASCIEPFSYTEVTTKPIGWNRLGGSVKEQLPVRLERLSWAVAVILVAVLIGATVGGGARVTTTSRTPGPAVVKGGKIVLAAQGYPECLNPLLERCSYSPWLYWSVIQYVMPRVTQLTTDGRYTNSPLVTEYPSLSNGGLIQSPFTVRYKLDPRAVWADGSAITCDDFEFTRNAIVNSEPSYTAPGYVPAEGRPGIDHIDCSDERTVVLAFSGPIADWPSFFGGATGVVLEKAAFPREMDQEKVDLSKEMKDDIPFSGGPWRLQSWSQSETVLVPNANYWGHKPNLDQVTIVPHTLGSPMELDDLLSGSVDAIFPQWDPYLILLLGGLGTVNPNIKVRVDPGLSWGIEGLWMNLSKPPFDDLAVRQALFWAVDRVTVLRKIIGSFDPSQQHPSGCGVAAYPGGFWCDIQPFAPFHYDLGKVNQVMTAAGYARDAVGFWAKGGKEVSFEYATTYKGVRIATQDLIEPGLMAAGFNVTARAVDPGLLYETKLPRGEFQLTDFPVGQRGVSSDPSPTNFLACDFIPSPANAYAGENVFRWCDQPATAVMKESDLELDPNSRRQLLDQVYLAEARDFAPGLPLYVKPNVTMWRADKIAGPVGLWNGTLYGGFFNIDEWYCARQGACG